MKDQVAVSLEERIFNDLNIKAQMQGNISPALQSMLDKTQEILDAQKISTEEDTSLEKIDLQLQNQNQQDLRKILLCDLRPLLIKAAILLDDIESIRIIMSYVKNDLANNNAALNNKINYSMIAIYAIDKKHLDLLDYTEVYDTIERVLSEDLDYKLKIFLESDPDIIAKITARNPDIFKIVNSISQVSTADLGIFYHEAIHYTAYENQKNSITKKRRRILDNDNLLTPSIIKDAIFNLNKLLNSKDYSAIVLIDIKLLEIFYKLNPEIFNKIPQSEKNNMLFYLCINAEPDSNTLIDFILKIGAGINEKDRYKDTPLHLAVKANNIELARLLLDVGADTEAEGYLNDTPLHLAVEADNIELVRLLLDAGADIKAKNNGDDTLLHQATKISTVEIVNLLLSYGADIEAKDDVDATPLHYAVLNRNAEMINLLLSYGADIEAKDDNGCTPLHLAVDQFDKNTTKLLLSYGADKEVKNNDGKTPLNMAFYNSSDEIIKLLENFKNIVKVHHDLSDGRQPLHDAALNGDIEAVRYLLSSDAKVDMKDKHNQTVFHYAARNGHADMIELLLSNQDMTKDLLNEKDINDGATALHIAAFYGYKEIAKLLVSSGADIELRDYRYRTNLHLSVLNGNIEIVELLLSFGLSKECLNEQDIFGNTALHYAVINNDNRGVDLLLAQENIDLTLKTAASNETALEIATRSNLEDIMQAILKKEQELAPKQSTTWVVRSSAQAAGSNREL
jgi:ankyrin repeat protein